MFDQLRRVLSAIAYDYGMERQVWRYRMPEAKRSITGWAHESPWMVLLSLLPPTAMWFLLPQMGVDGIVLGVLGALSVVAPLMFLAIRPFLLQDDALYELEINGEWVTMRRSLREVAAIRLDQVARIEERYGTKDRTDYAIIKLVVSGREGEVLEFPIQFFRRQVLPDYTELRTTLKDRARRPIHQVAGRMPEGALVLFFIIFGALFWLVGNYPRHGVAPLLAFFTAVPFNWLLTADIYSWRRFFRRTYAAPGLITNQHP